MLCCPHDYQSIIQSCETFFHVKSLSDTYRHVNKLRVINQYTIIKCEE
jgi:hypothetical protein